MLAFNELGESHDGEGLASVKGRSSAEKEMEETA
jgi:hypothetical protein